MSLITNVLTVSGFLYLFVIPIVDGVLKGVTKEKVNSLISEIDELVVEHASLNNVDIKEFVMSRLMSGPLEILLKEYPLFAYPVRIVLVSMLNKRFDPLIMLQKVKDANQTT